MKEVKRNMTKRGLKENIFRIEMNKEGKINNNRNAIFKLY